MDSAFEIPGRTESVIRWQGCQLIGKRKNISEHCFETAIYSLIIYNSLSLQKYEIDKGVMLNLAITHDIAEIITGDIPVSVKQRIPEIKTLLDKMESEVNENELKLVNCKADLKTKFVVKVSDYICVSQELFKELELGNKTAPIIKAIEVVNNIWKNIYDVKFKDVEPKLKEEVLNFLRINFNNRLNNSLNI